MIIMPGPAEGTPLNVVGRVREVSHEMDNNLNMSLKMSHGVLECDIVTLQNHTLMIL